MIQTDPRFAHVDADADDGTAARDGIGAHGRAGPGAPGASPGKDGDDQPTLGDQVQQLVAIARLWLQVKKDQTTARARDLALAAVMAVVFAMVAGTVLVTGIVLAVAGLTRLIGRWTGMGADWAGVAVGVALLVLAMTSLAIARSVLRRRSLAATEARYAQESARQQARDGRTLREVADMPAEGQR